MDAKKVFKSPYTSRIVKQYLQKHRHFKTASEVYEALNLTDERLAVRKAIYHLKKHGKIVQDNTGYHYIGDSEIKGCIADQVWDLMRYSRVFDANTLTRGTTASTHYIRKLLRGYLTAGYIQLVGLERPIGSNKPIHQYRIITDRRVRPCLPEKKKEESSSS